MTEPIKINGYNDADPMWQGPFYTIGPWTAFGHKRPKYGQLVALHNVLCVDPVVARLSEGGREWFSPAFFTFTDDRDRWAELGCPLCKGSDPRECRCANGFPKNTSHYQIGPAFPKSKEWPCACGKLHKNEDFLPGRPASLTDDELRTFWKAEGGGFFGPIVEQGCMPEAKLLPLLRRLLTPHPTPYKEST